MPRGGRCGCTRHRQNLSRRNHTNEQHTASACLTPGPPARSRAGEHLRTRRLESCRVGEQSAQLRTPDGIHSPPHRLHADVRRWCAQCASRGLKAAIGERVCLMGGIELKHLEARPAEYIEELVRNTMAAGKPGGRYTDPWKHPVFRNRRSTPCGGCRNLRLTHSGA